MNVPPRTQPATTMNSLEILHVLLQAELKKSGWSEAVLESLRYLFASEQEVKQGSALDPLQWFQALIKYKEIPNVMTAWKQEQSEQTEQQVFQVSHRTSFSWS